jgi:hypothetical protein
MLVVSLGMKYTPVMGVCSPFFPSRITVPAPSIGTAEPSPNLTTPRTLVSISWKAERLPDIWFVAPVSRCHTESSRSSSPLSSWAKTLASTTSSA